MWWPPSEFVISLPNGRMFCAADRFFASLGTQNFCTRAIMQSDASDRPFYPKADAEVKANS
jgi:hypothetical protein